VSSIPEIGEVMKKRRQNKSPPPEGVLEKGIRKTPTDKKIDRLFKVRNEPKQQAPS